MGTNLQHLIILFHHQFQSSKPKPNYSKLGKIEHPFLFIHTTHCIKPHTTIIMWNQTLTSCRTRFCLFTSSSLFSLFPLSPLLLFPPNENEYLFFSLNPYYLYSLIGLTNLTPPLLLIPPLFRPNWLYLSINPNSTNTHIIK